MLRENAEKISTVEHRDPFETLFLQNYSRIYELLYRLTGNRAEAEDLTVETFVRLWRKGPKQAENFSGWLYTVATRLGFNSLRSAKRRSSYEETAALHTASHALSMPDQEIEVSQKKQRVWNTLRNIPRRDAEILVLHHSGFSYKEISAAIGVSPNSIGKLLSRAEKAFEKTYMEDTYESSE